jgi:UDP-GlcNAc:undecaprenyl-phosphate GlcNAc-1-phosphate transferase
LPSSILLTLALTVAVVNAMNFVDGLDGLAAGLGLITAMAICIYSVGLLRSHGGDVLFYPPAVISVVLAGACLGFLPHNFHPARIFMGDVGAMTIGYVLGLSAIIGGAKLATALLVMGVPLIDMAWLILSRTLQGGSAAHAGRDHLHTEPRELRSGGQVD